jgi:hypothetical protein
MHGNWKIRAILCFIWDFKAISIETYLPLPAFTSHKVMAWSGFIRIFDYINPDCITLMGLFFFSLLQLELLILRLCMVSICWKRGSVRFIEPRRTLTFRERGVFIDQIVQVIVDAIALVSRPVEPLRIHLHQLLACNMVLSTYVCRTAFPWPMWLTEYITL